MFIAWKVGGKIKIKGRTKEENEFALLPSH